MNGFACSVLLVEPDQARLQRLSGLYTRLLATGDLPAALHAPASTVLRTASDLRTATSLLEQDFARAPMLLQVVLLPESLEGGERGSDFLERMRWKFAGRRFGGLLFGEQGSSQLAESYRRRGAYHYLPRPHTSAALLSSISTLTQAIFSREKAPRRAKAGSFSIRPVDSRELFEQYVRLRYRVWSEMGYIPNELRMERAAIEVDAFDVSAVPFVAIDEHQRIGAAGRLVMRSRQPPYDRWVEQLLRDHGQQRVLRRVMEGADGLLPTERVYRLDSYRAERGAKSREFGEYSRCITAPDCRGLGLSRQLTESVQAHALEHGLRYLIAGFVPQHASMYAQYGFRVLELEPAHLRGTDGRIQDGKLALFESVAQVAHVAVADLTELPAPTCSHVEALRAAAAQRRAFAR